MLEVKNVGKASLKILSVKISHPQFICFGKATHMNETFQGEDDIGEVIEKIVTDNIFDNQSIYKIPLKFPLEPNKGVMIPCKK
jgi:hypothetical protein